MNTNPQKALASPKRDSGPGADYRLLVRIAFLISIFAVAFYFRHGAILLYGDAVAHINIARRVFDSRTPGIFQLGTVWLALPHLIDAPFIANDWMWTTGLGASIPSMIAYIAGILGIFRLLRGYASRLTSWIGALLYALNPNLIYMQATAMTEVLYLAFFIWAVVYLCEFVRDVKVDAERGRKSLERCAMMVSAAMLVRYDGWFLAAAIALAAVFIAWRWGWSAPPVRKAIVRFVLLTGLTAGLWLAYNYANFYNPLEFATGPYSTRAIVSASSMPVYPGKDHPRTAAIYFLKAARLNLSEGGLEYALLNIAFVTALAALCFSRRHWPALLLWVPVLFYTLSIAWASVPIYIPQWWPHSYYNVRYGLQMLPAVAVFGALAFEFLAKIMPMRIPGVMILLMAVASYYMVWQKGPICLREAQANGSGRMMFEQHLALELQKLPPGATLMMNCGAHGGALQNAGIHLRRVLQEGNHPEWTTGLSAPARAADYLVVFQGDELSYAVRAVPQGLQTVAIVETPGYSQATIYRSMH
ncbi:MAG TPA: glycosyltransferase family 39 protein [Candidatus Angelobacter sp.]|nr:glycosyltransferase family 39 protein [Candidatus Angelobacter sp.]